MASRHDHDRLPLPLEESAMLSAWSLLEDIGARGTGEGVPVPVPVPGCFFLEFVSFPLNCDCDCFCDFSSFGSSELLSLSVVFPLLLWLILLSSFCCFSFCFFCC